MYLVFTTSTGEAITVVQKPAPKADVKWHGRSSAEGKKQFNTTFSKCIPLVHTLTAEHRLNLATSGGPLKINKLPVKGVDLRSASLIKS